MTESDSTASSSDGEPGWHFAGLRIVVWTCLAQFLSMLILRVVFRRMLQDYESSAKLSPETAREIAGSLTTVMSVGEWVMLATTWGICAGVFLYSRIAFAPDVRRRLFASAASLAIVGLASAIFLVDGLIRKPTAETTAWSQLVDHLWLVQLAGYAAGFVLLFVACSLLITAAQEQVRGWFMLVVYALTFWHYGLPVIRSYAHLAFFNTHPWAALTVSSVLGGAFFGCVTVHLRLADYAARVTTRN